MHKIAIGYPKKQAPRKVLYSIFLTGFLFFASTQTSLAQNMDYGALEELFEEPVTTSATGKPQRSSEVPTTMEIITAEDIRRSGASNIPDALKGVSGIDVVQSSVSTYDIGIRGYNQFYSPRLLVLINGRQVYMDHFGYTAWSTLPVQLPEIRQIEVVKGPNAALYGFNAVSGVINIITYNPLFDEVNNVTIRGGTQNYQGASFVTSLRTENEKAGLRLSMGGFQADAFESDQNVLAAEQAAGFNRDSHDRSFSADGLWQVTDDVLAGLEYTHSIVKQTEIYPTLTMGRADYETNSIKGTLAAETALGSISLNSYKNFLDVDYKNLPNLGGDVDFNNEVTVVSLQDLFKAGLNHVIRLALEYRYNESTTTPFEGATVSYDVYSGSAMWDWHINERVSLTNAIRLDRLDLDRDGPFPPNALSTDSDYNQKITEVGYNSGLVWKATDSDTITVSTARGIQAPSLVEFGAFTGDIGPFHAGGDPNLDPTVVTNYEIGYKHTFDEFDLYFTKMNTQFIANGFYQKSEDVKVLTGLLAPTIANQFLSENVGKTSTYGLEVGLKATLGEHWRLGTNYTYQKINDDIRNTNAAGSFTQRLNFEDTIPNHIFNITVGYSDDKWEADALAQYVSDRDFLRAGGDPFATPFLVGVNSVVNLSSRVGYKITEDWMVSLSGQNLLYDRTDLSSAPEVERRLYVTLSGDF